MSTVVRRRRLEFGLSISELYGAETLANEEEESNWKFLWKKISENWKVREVEFDKFFRSIDWSKSVLKIENIRSRRSEDVGF